MRKKPPLQRPPKIAHWLLERFVNKDIRYSALGDFEEIYATLAEYEGTFLAKFWYWKQVVKSLPLFIADSFYWRFYMLQNYLKVVLRRMMRQKVFSFINIAGLAIGMAVCILILLWVQDELSYDRFHQNAENIYRVVMNDQRYGMVWPVVSIPLGPALRQEFPEITDSVRIFDFIGLATRGEKKFDEIGAFVDPSFFNIFSFKFVEGDSRTALQDPTSIVLSQGLAKKIFGNEDPIGENLKLNNDLDLNVTGVIEDMPQNSHLHLAFLASFKIFEQKDRDPTNWGRFQVYTYIQLQDHTLMESVKKKIAGILQEHGVRSGPKLELEPMTRIHLYAQDGGGNILYVYIFSIIAIFILVIACINFMNLTTARSSTRTKEIGMRKVTGAQRTDLIKQFLGESVLISLIALAFAIVLVILMLPAFNDLANKQMTFFPDNSGNLIPGFLGIVIFTGLLAGGYPAFFLSSFKPSNILRGSLTPTSRGKQKTLFRKALVVFQFAISVFMIISTLVIFRQLHFISNRNLGFQKKHVLSIPMRGNSSQVYEAFKSELLRDPGIQNVTAVSESPIVIGKIHMGYEWEGKDPDKESRMYEILVDHDFVNTMNMTIVQGRDFSREYTTDASKAFILNEAAVKYMDIESPVGKDFSFGAREGTIIGIVKDFHFRPLHEEIEPLVMFIEPEKFNYLCIKIESEVSGLPGIIEYIERLWKKFEPSFPFSYNFLDETFDWLYRSEQRTGRIFGYFTFLAIFVSCLGIFGLAAQISEQRAKEIGIRKVMGASVSGIALLLSKDFMKWIMIANVIAWPSAYYAVKKWLQNFAYRANLGVEIFIFAFTIAFFIALITVSFQVIRVALSNPVDSLRYE